MLIKDIKLSSIELAKEISKIEALENYAEDTKRFSPELFSKLMLEKEAYKDYVLEAIEATSQLSKILQPILSSMQILHIRPAIAKVGTLFSEIFLITLSKLKLQLGELIKALEEKEDQSLVLKIKSEVVKNIHEIAMIDSVTHIIKETFTRFYEIFDRNSNLSPKFLTEKKDWTDQFREEFNISKKLIPIKKGIDNKIIGKNYSMMKDHLEKEEIGKTQQIKGLDPSPSSKIKKVAELVEIEFENGKTIYGPKKFDFVEGNGFIKFFRLKKQNEFLLVTIIGKLKENIPFGFGREFVDHKIMNKQEVKNCIKFGANKLNDSFKKNLNHKIYFEKFNNPKNDQLGNNSLKKIFFNLENLNMRVHTSMVYIMV